jgi:hypothetical protein
LTVVPSRRGAISARLKAQVSLVAISSRCPVRVRTCPRRLNAYGTAQLSHTLGVSLFILVLFILVLFFVCVVAATSNRAHPAASPRHAAPLPPHCRSQAAPRRTRCPAAPTPPRATPPPPARPCRAWRKRRWPQSRQRLRAYPGNRVCRAPTPATAAARPAGCCRRRRPCGGATSERAATAGTARAAAAPHSGARVEMARGSRRQRCHPQLVRTQLFLARERVSGRAMSRGGTAERRLRRRRRCCRRRCSAVARHWRAPAPLVAAGR